MLRPYSILLYFLAVLLGFILGLMYAGLIDAGKGQMLAAGAIVLGYGVLGSGIGLMAALAFAWWSGPRTIVGSNMVLALTVTSFLAFYMGKNERKQEANSVELLPKTHIRVNKKVSQEIDQPAEPRTSGTHTAMESAVPDNSLSSVPSEQSGQGIGLGLFAPDIMQGKPMYFYRRPFLQWPPPKADIVDSITFHRDEYGNPAISTAPPWFMPVHMKMDYGIMFVKIKTVHRHSLEVEVNKETGRTALISKTNGRVVFWPEFLVSVYSIELKDKNLQKIRVKPLDYAGEVKDSYTILKPVAIRDNWIHVHLMDNDQNRVGKGWVKWREEGRLLVNYSLLS